MEPWAGRLNELLDRIANGPPLTLTTALLATLSPRFVTVTLACFAVPTGTTPKARPVGRTSICGEARARPVRVLVELPPLLVMTALPLKVPG